MFELEGHISPDEDDPCLRGASFSGGFSNSNCLIFVDMVSILSEREARPRTKNFVCIDLGCDVTIPSLYCHRHQPQTGFCCSSLSISFPLLLLRDIFKLLQYMISQVFCYNSKNSV